MGIALHFALQPQNIERCEWLSHFGPGHNVALGNTAPGMAMGGIIPGAQHGQAVAPPAIPQADRERPKADADLFDAPRPMHIGQARR